MADGQRGTTSLQHTSLAMSDPVSLLDAAKAKLRREQRAKRKLAFAAEPQAGHAVATRVFTTISLPPEAPLSAFWPMGDELDVRPLITRAAFAGHPVGLPVMLGKAQPLIFRRWRPGDLLADGGFGTSIPTADKPEIVPQILIVPLLAFDRAGFRLGYGGGFYDRTLEKLRALGPVLAIGVAFAAQEVVAVPRDEHDQRLDWIVTETDAFQPGS